MGILDETMAALKRQAAVSDHVAVAYSDGKDSRVVLDLCVRSFRRVDAFFMYLVPGLECIDSALAETERRYGITIRQYPHWLAEKLLRQGIFCREMLYGDGLPKTRLMDVHALALLDTGAGCVATGAKKSDSAWRRRFMSTPHQDRVLNPIAQWHKYDVLSYLRARKIPEPPSSGHSATGIDLSVPSLLWLADTYPEDFKRLCEVFPYAGAVTWRREFYGR